MPLSPTSPGASSLPVFPPQTAIQHSIANVIAAIGDGSFAERTLRALNGALAAGSWAVYQCYSGRPPVLHLSASHGVPDTTQHCFAAYRDEGLYRRDASLDAVQSPNVAAGQPVLLRMHAEQAPSVAHRDAIYARHGLVERLSVAARQSDGSVLAVNLYHHGHQGRFSDGELANFGDLAPALLAGVGRHLQLRPPTPCSTRAALRARCAALTERELDVLERLLKGLSYDGIAADLGLSVSTVKTYRARAFGRLDMHFKSELFAGFVRLT